MTYARNTLISLISAIIYVSPTACFAQVKSSEVELLVMVPQVRTVDAAPIDFSPDGRLLASSNQLWDMRSRRMVRILPATGVIGRVRFSPDSVNLAGLASYSVFVWDIQTGRLLTTLRLAGETPTSVAYQPGSNKLAVGYRSGKIRLWDVRSAQSSVIGDAASAISDICFDASGRYLAAGSTEGLRLFDLTVGANRLFHHSSLKTAETVAISPDGARVAAGDTGSLVIWDAAGAQVTGTYPHSGQICFTPDGRSLLNLRQSYESLDGALTLGNSIDVLDATTGKRSQVMSRSYGIYHIRPDPGGLLVAGSGFGSIALFDIQTGRDAGFLQGYSLPGANLAFSHDGNVLAVSAGQLLILWSRKTGRTMRVIKLTDDYSPRTTSAIFFSPGDDTVYAVTSEGVRRWSVAGGPEMPTLKKLADSPLNSPDYYTVSYITGLLSKDGKRVYGIRRLRKSVKDVESDLTCCKIDVWDSGTGAKLTTFGDDKWTVDNDHSGTWIWRAALQPNGNLLATNRIGEANVQIWDTIADRLINNFDAGVGPISTLAFGPVGNTLAVGGETGGLKVCDASTTKIVLDLSGHTHEVSLVFTLDGDRLISASDDGVFVWKLADGSRLYRFDQGDDNPWDMAVTADGSLCATTGASGTTRVWSLAAGTPFFSSTASDTGEMVVSTPQGYYMGAPAALNAVAFRMGSRAYPFEQFDLRLNRPDRVLSAMQCRDAALIDAYHSAYQKRVGRSGFTDSQVDQTPHIPDVRITSTALPLKTTARDLTIPIAAEEADPGLFLDQLKVFINDVPSEGVITVGGQAGASPRSFTGAKGCSLRVEKIHRLAASITVPLSVGSNKVQISCLNSQGMESLKQTVYVTYSPPTPPARPTLYLVTVGVSKYSDDRFSLKYASKDATDLLDFFKSHAAGFSDVHTLPLLNGDAIRDNIVASIRTFLQPANHDDYVVLFFAGHGLLDDKQDYYFGTPDVRFDAPAAQGLAYESIDTLLDGTRARHKLLFVDTCHSGEVDKEAPAPARGAIAPNSQTPMGTIVTQFPRGVKAVGAGQTGLQNSFTLMQTLFADLHRGSGTAVIAAASGVGYSLESERWRNGVFTASLLEALQANPRIKVSALQQAVAKRVLELTGGQQTPTVRQESVEFDFPVLGNPP